MSAIDRTRPWCLIQSSRPNRFAAGFCAASVSREMVGPLAVTFGSVGPPLVTKT